MYKNHLEIKQIQREDCLKYAEFDLKYKVNTYAPTTSIIEDAIVYTVPYFEENSYDIPGSTGYQPTANHWIDLINIYFKDQVNEYKFIDVGCGKGKPIIYNIVNNAGYRGYLGIEIDPHLSKIFNEIGRAHV